MTTDIVGILGSMLVVLATVICIATLGQTVSERIQRAIRRRRYNQLWKEHSNSKRSSNSKGSTTHKGSSNSKRSNIHKRSNLHKGSNIHKGSDSPKYNKRRK